MNVLRWCALALGYLVTISLGYLALLWIDHIRANVKRRRQGGGADSHKEGSG